MTTKSPDAAPQALDLDALRRLAEASTDWSYDSNMSPFYNDPEGNSCGGNCTGTYSIFGPEIVIDGEVYDPMVLSECCGKIDAKFISEAKQAVLALLDEVEKARQGQAQTQLSGWISVAEALPDLDEPVWLYEDGNAWIGARSDGGDGWLWCHCDGSEYMMSDGKWDARNIEADDDYQPTYWMRLPMTPEQTRMPGAARQGGDTSENSDLRAHIAQLERSEDDLKDQVKGLEARLREAESADDSTLSGITQSLKED